MCSLRTRVLDRDDLEIESINSSGRRGRHTVNLRHVGVPLPECLCAPLDTPLSVTVGDLQLQGFSQAPVRVSNSPVGWRLVTIEELKHLDAQGLTLDEEPRHYQPSDLLEVESVHVPLSQLFRQLSAARATIVFCCWRELPKTRDDIDSIDIGGGLGPANLSSGVATDADVYALVAISDLNRREVRKAAYELLLDLEEALAELVRRRFRDPWDWINHAGDSAQVRILGRWQQAKQREIEIDPVEFAMISDLLKVVRETEELRALLELPSKNKLDALSWKVTDFRNRVMHPARQLVLDQSDVISAYEATEFIGRLATRLEAVIAG